MERYGWIGTIYYYVAALIGLGMLIGAALSISNGVLDAAAPSSTDDYIYNRYPVPFYEEGEPRQTPSPDEVAKREKDARDAVRTRGVRQAAEGAIVGAVGGPIFLWHLRRARRRETPGEASD